MPDVTFVRDPTLTAKSLFFTQQEVGHPGAKTIQGIDREESAAGSWDSFSRAMRSAASMSDAERPFMVLMCAVGMVVSGRHGLYTLMHYPASGVTAAVNVADSDFVGIMRTA